ncbi:uncharacterized protein LOC128293777 [Gossypium arboreum]|uniref:uncharacterized protein LOC128293777 n=1 Tax=Gossypium arboreum TaxID=29729 RepID=UPI0022F184DC|nr:uncharacterized protein LOC128293777 [Gossypium arboreum]
MESEFSDKVEYNAFTQKWSENTQLEKGDSLAEGYTSELWDFTRISVAQNDLRELKEIWSHWDGEMKQLFYHNYGDMSYLLDIKVDKHLFRAMAQFWNSTYSCFTFGKVVAQVQQKGDGKCIPWVSLRELILIHPDMKRRVDVFALSVYGLVVFPKALRHIDEAVTNLFDQLGKGITPVPAILAETFRSLNACRRASEGRFIGCAQLLLVWFNSHFWKMEKVSYQHFLQNFFPLKEIAAMSRRDDISEERWMTILQNLQEDDIEDLGGIGYTPLLVLRQYRSRQFIPATQGLAQSEFFYKGDNYKKKVREICNAWNRTYQMEGVAVNPMVTLEYNEWRRRRVNDNILRPNLEDARPLEEYLRMWRQEIQEEKAKTDQWKKKFHDTKAREAGLEKSLDDSQSEKEVLRARVAELEKALH